ncbi:MAG: hypothetical protein CL821_05370 [Crocinitomicaceae bacterium]|nr:hypothetical protein [Crocinitomicaceae bacterium]
MNHPYSLNISKYLFLLILIIPFSLNSQNEYLTPYIPFDSCNLSTHPELEIRVWVHVIQKSNDNPENLTADSLNFIKNQFNWINSIYSNLKPPSIKPSYNKKSYIKDSRIRFVVDTTTFHIDEVAWDRMKLVIEENKKRWMKILAIDSDSGTVKIAGIRDKFKEIQDSIIITNTIFNNGIFSVKRIKKKGANTVLTLENDIQISEDSIGFVTYYKKIDKNCSLDNWINLTKENKDYLHVFYTGSSLSVPTFGCGPSPYFLNVSKILTNGEYASAQLTAHELGHCLGLRHTNNPQFSDLPSSDKFGWIPCNKSTVSNNIMGYNLCRNYLSPYQIAYIHYRYANNNEIYKTLHNSLSNQLVSLVKENTIWGKNVLASGTIIIKKNQSLTIKKELIIPNNGVIIMEKNSALIVDNGKIYCPGKNWQGIIKKNSSCMKLFSRKKSSEIILKNNGVIVY